MARKIAYETLLSNALLNVVKDVLKIVEKEGFFKKQHLYVSFATDHPGAELSEYLKEDYPDEMTIVLQHEFWDLTVDNYGFRVGLAFDSGSEMLYIPFSSIIRVNDPSEDFCLEFAPDYNDMKAKQEPKFEANSPEDGGDEEEKVISFSDFLKGK